MAVNLTVWGTLVVMAVKDDRQTPTVLKICFSHNGTWELHEMYTQQPVFLESQTGGCTVTDFTFATIQAVQYNYYSVGFVPVWLYAIFPPRWSGISQVAVDKVVQGLDRVLAYQDDVVAFGTIRKGHNSRLKSVLGRLIQRNVSIKTNAFLICCALLVIFSSEVRSRFIQCLLIVPIH